MKNNKKLFLILALTIASVPISTNLKQNCIYAENNKKNQNKIKIDKNTIEKIDKLVKVKDNKFILEENEIFEEITKDYSVKNNISQEEFKKIIKDRISLVNEDISINQKEIIKDKNIVSTISFRDREWVEVGHDVEEKWWGTRHFLYNKEQVNKFTYILKSVSSNEQILGLLFAVDSPAVEAVFELHTVYLNRMTLDIENHWKKYQKPFCFDIAWTYNYNFEVQ